MKTLKPLIELTDRNKSIYFSLSLYDIQDKISKRCEQWFNDVFKSNLISSEEIHTRNLLSDLDFIFSQGIFVIELAESLNLDINDAKRFFVSSYKKYTTEGYKALIDPCVYNKKEHRAYTAEEIIERDERINKIAIDLVNKLK